MVMPVFNNQILGLKRTSAPSSVPNEEDEVAVSVHQDFHQALEEIQREHPHLSKGAMQRMAVERCARKMKGDQPDQAKRAPDLLRGFKSMVRNIGKGKNNGDDTFDDAGGGKDDIDDTMGSTVRASNVDPDSKKVLRQRRSVCSFSFRRSMVVDPSDSDEDNLEDSLENIEQSYMSYNSNANRQSPQRRSSRRRSSDDDSKNRKSHRSSDVSLDLSDVEEDNERKAQLDASEELGASRGESTSSAQKNTRHSESVSKLLPNEIKEALGNFSLGDNQGPSPVKQGRRKSRRRSRAMARSPRADAESSDSDSRRSSVFSSFMSSFMSTEGDFSAWSSMKGRSKD
jgi:hypothetical protein